MWGRRAPSENKYHLQAVGVKNELFSHPEGLNYVEGPAMWVNCLILFSIFRQICSYILHELKLNLVHSLQGA